MKSIKLLSAALLAVMAASSALAVLPGYTYIRFTGSTAFRTSTVTAIGNVLDNGVYDSATNPTGYVSAGNSADKSGSTTTWVGTYLNTPVVIQANWTGAVDGIRDITGGANNTYLTGEETVLKTSGAITPIPYANVSLAGVTETGVADIALTDNTQAVTAFKAATLIETKVGVVPFVFVKGRLEGTHPYKDTWASLSTISALGARKLIGGGTPLSVLTGGFAPAEVALGSAAYTTYSNNGTNTGTDARMYALPLGRNKMSGTRVITFSESGFGLVNSANQYKANSTASTPITASGNITTAVRFPASTPTGTDAGGKSIVAAGTYPAISLTTGDNGFASGGTMADELSATVLSTAKFGTTKFFGFIGYMGTSDAARFLKAVNTNVGTDTSYILGYNGSSIGATYNNASQTTTWDYTNVKEGRYSFWFYEYLSYKNTLAGTPKAFGDAVATRLVSSSNTDATLSGIHLTDMKVTRAGEGSVVAAP